jgi:hypothetical protein
MTNGERIQTAVAFARAFAGMHEEPIGSNRGLRIDDWAREFGSPVGSPWCALAVAKARRMGGLWVPERDAGACNQWVLEGRRLRLLSDTPAVGAAVIYTDHQRIVGGRYDGQLHAVHMGLVCDATAQLAAIEGNTSLTRFEHDGWIQAVKPIDTARVLCYVRPVPSWGSANAA